MNNRNTIIISSLTLLIGIGIGRFTAPPANESTTATHNRVAPAEKPAAANVQTPRALPANAGELATAAKAAFSKKDNQPAATTQGTLPAAEPANTNRNSTYDGSAESATKNYPNEITPDEIDRVLPAPFNDSFKHAHGFLREKYKDFVANTQPDDWDIRMQNKITDFIFSSPYAKFLNVESLLCKSGLCEIRLFETKQGTFSMILSEMALQDWWDIGGYHASGNGTGDGRTAYHVLLPRK